MNLNLSPETQYRIDLLIETGKFPSREDVVAAALVALEGHVKQHEFEPNELASLLAAAEQSIESEGTLDGDDAFRARSEDRTRRFHAKP